jgi:hypothetical protein
MPAKKGGSSTVTVTSSTDTDMTDIVTVETAQEGTDVTAADSSESMDIDDTVENTYDGEEAFDTGLSEGEDYTTDEIIADDGMNDMNNEGIEGDMIFDPGFDEGMLVDPGMGMDKPKDPLLSSWFFVIGISVAVLAVSIALGAFLARLRIKKGIDLYED